MEVNKQEVYTIILSAEEIKMIKEGIGRTSVKGRVYTGMTLEQSEAFSKLYQAIVDATE